MDVLSGENGNDTVAGGSGADMISGGTVTTFWRACRPSKVSWMTAPWTGLTRWTAAREMTH
ncbi:hypothetical protein ACFSHQ_13840 [Gemmobacter lanyuensis]